MSDGTKGYRDSNRDSPESTPDLTCDGWSLVVSILARRVLKLLIGAQITPLTNVADACRGVDDLIPRRTWWRHEARRGMRDIEAYLR